MSPIVVFHAVHRENAPTRRVFKIEILKISGSALAAEICTGPHNRLLQRQHCSSLCSQSEGHEHIANMTNALGHDFVGFSARAWPPQYSPPSLCEQSELQCFAPGLRQMSARCPLLRCHTRYAICSQNRTDTFLNFEHPTQRGLNALPSSRASPPFQAPNIPALFAFPTGACCRKSNSPIRPLCQSANHAPDADAPRPRCGRITPQTRACLDPDVIVSRPRRADKSYFPRILDNQPIDIIKMKYLSRNHRETCREPPRRKKSPYDSQIAIAISIGIAMLLADCTSAKPVFSPDNITIFAILM